MVFDKQQNCIIITEKHFQLEHGYLKNIEETVERAIKKGGHKLTRQRLYVIDILKSSKKQLTPSEIYEAARLNGYRLGLVTIYRTLEILNEANIVCRIYNHNKKSGYVLRRPQGHHHHVLCQQCGITTDFGFCDLASLESKVEKTTGFVITGHSLQLDGICPACCLATSL